MEKKMDFLEKEYGIKEDDRYYYVMYKSERYHGYNDEIKVNGEVLNFCPQQLVLKGDKGLFIIHPKNIIEMRPIKKLIQKQVEENKEAKPCGWKGATTENFSKDSEDLSKNDLY